MSISNAIIDSIEMIANDSVEKAGYDKTIQAQILSCQDATIGKYRCRYQDAIFYAYTNNTDLSFGNGAYVYILVPNGDMSKEKTILGTAKKLGINYISQVEGDQAYDINGNNAVTSKDIYYLDTNNQDYKYIIYQANPIKDEAPLVKDIDFDEIALQQHIKESSSVIVGAIIQTNIPVERQSRGHYGITYNLRFLDAVSMTEVIRSYTVNEDNMIDNPYRLARKTRQYDIFNIDGPNFIRLESIQIFNRDFPEATGSSNEKLFSGDIEISNLQIFGATRMSEEEINGVAISFYTPQGTFFGATADKEQKKKIVAQVKVKGKLVQSDQNISFYWGSENVGITPRSIYYNKKLGNGWKCLNQYSINEIPQLDEDGNPITEIDQNGDLITKVAKTEIIWAPGGDTFILRCGDATARNNKFKVAIDYNGTIITKEITIQNLNTVVPLLTIESSEGTKFYHDIGHPTLTCKVFKVDEDEKTEQPVENYDFYWAYESNTGVFSELPETETDNENYNNAVDALYQLEEQIALGTAFENISKDELTTKRNLVKSFDYIQRVENNKVYNVQIRNITSFGIFKCSVYDKDENYLGTTSIKLTNTLDGEKVYSLIINNGDAAFQYDEDGIAPNNGSLETPQQLKALTFTIYDNLGQPIDSDIIAKESNCKIRWAVPIKNTMIVDKQDIESSSGTDATLNYRHYDNRTTLIYNIAQRYNIKNQRNQIRLTVDYKGMTLTAETRFSFMKQGQPGTNGTQYIVKLVPNTKMDNPPLYPMITRIAGSYTLNYGLNNSNDSTVLTLDQSYQLFKAQLLHNGDKVWEGITATDEYEQNDERPILVKWQVLRNIYKSTSPIISDDSNFEVEKDHDLEGIIKLNKGWDFDSIKKDATANIIKCSIKWQDKTYYGTIPITTAIVHDENYQVKLKDYTGWRYAVYTSDGVLPQYDNSHPFEFICLQNIHYKKENDNTDYSSWEDISLIPIQQEQKIINEHGVSYEISSVSNYYGIDQDGKSGFINANLIEVLNSDAYIKNLQQNQRNARPTPRYDGYCVNASIICTYTQKHLDDQGKPYYLQVGAIKVPIHFLLNKYGLSYLNDWDGNSIQINKEDGYILSPQIGAGNKDNNNTFTGVLMGEVKIPTKKNSDIGLLGYSNGDRTFFLNSRNGSALFGKSKAGQIIIDPSSDKAMIYSGNFWDEKNYDQDGLPKDYGYRNNNSYAPKEGICAKKGMIIDLSTPEIFFGSGKFYVNKDGEMHAAGGGTIGGWKIGDTSLTGGSISIDSAGKIYSGNHNELGSGKNGFFLSENGLSIGSKVKIDNTGVMKLGSGAVSDSSSSCWTIDGSDTRSYIAFGGSKKLKESTVYLGTDGISLGNDKFSVSQKGELISKSGTIGGWNISGSDLKAQNMTLSSTGFLKGAEVKDKNNKVTNYAWEISTTGVATFDYLKANGGKIGGWNISRTSLTGGGISINSGGSIQCKDSKGKILWSLNSDGTANFKNKVTINNFAINGSGSFGSGGSISGGGMRMGSGSYVNPNQVGYGANSNQTLYQGLKAKFDEIYATKATFDDLDVMKKLKYGNKSARWVTVVRNIGGINLNLNGKKLTVSISVGYAEAIGANPDPTSHQPYRASVDLPQ